MVAALIKCFGDVESSLTTIKLSGLRWRICQSARLPPPLTWVQFPLGTTYDSYVKRVSQRSAESRGFSPGTPVSSHREC